MGSRERAIDIGAARAREVLARLPAEARSARLSAGLGQADVASALGISVAQYSPIERGLSPDLTIATAVRLYAVLGLDLSVRAYPVGDPIRDAAHVALLERLRRLCHPSITWRTEVPFPMAGDLRAWDATADYVALIEAGAVTDPAEEFAILAFLRQSPDPAAKAALGDD